jgi:hypothetical protein
MTSVLKPQLGSRIFGYYTPIVIAIRPKKSLILIVKFGGAVVFQCPTRTVSEPGKGRLYTECTEETHGKHGKWIIVFLSNSVFSVLLGEICVQNSRKKN